MPEKIKAPYTDFAGNDLHLGDRIQHPNGDLATVVYDDARTDSGCWRAVYDDTGESLWLGNQIGDKGQAIRLDKALNATQGEWSRWASQRNAREQQLVQADLARAAIKAADPFNQRGADKATEKEIESNAQKDRSHVN